MTLANGQTRTANDVVLANNQYNSKWTGSSTVSPAAAAVAINAKGHGDVKDLSLAMSSDATLLTLVTNFKALAATSTWDQLKTAATAILFRWAGVDTTAATPIITGFDQQKLAFLEKFGGDQLLPRVAGVPQPTGAPEALSAWEDALKTLTIRLAAQGPMKATLGNLTHDMAQDAFAMPGAATLAGIYSTALAALSTTPATALTQWTTNWGPMLKEYGDTLLRANGIAVKVAMPANDNAEPLRQAS